MSKLARILLMLAVVGLVASGCETGKDPFEPQDPVSQRLIFLSGSEELGDIEDDGIILADGTGIVAAGVGLRGDPSSAQPGTIEIDIPGDPLQAFIYWEGQNATEGGDDEIEVDGIPVTGDLIGGITEFFGGAWSSAYRAELPEEIVLTSGINSIEVGGLDFTRGCPDCRNNGASLFVIYDDGSDPAEIGVKDGLDLAFFDFDPPLDATTPVIFEFTAATEERTATLILQASSVGDDRPNVVDYDFDTGESDRLVDPFQNNDGPDWDTVTFPVTIPVGATSMTVEAKSEADPDSPLPGIPASLAWTMAALSVPPVEDIPQEGCTRSKGYWRNHTGEGNGNQDDEVTPLLPIWLGDPGGDESLHVTTVEMAYDILGQHEYCHPNNGITKLYAQLLAAKLNVASGADDSEVEDEIEDADEFLADYNCEDWDNLTEEQEDDVKDWKNLFDDYNNGRIGPGHCPEDEDEEEENGNRFRRGDLGS